MKRTIIQRTIIFGEILTILFLFATCSNEIPFYEPQNKASVSIFVMDSLVRTVLPQVSLDDVAVFKLFGGIDSELETELAEFTSMGTVISLEPGTWNFTLNAYNNSDEHILQGKIENRQINLTGSNELGFTLYVLNSGIGGIYITFNFPIAANITRIIVDGDTSSEEFASISNGTFVYTKNMIATGNYFINFSFYSGDALRASIGEQVLVRSNLTSCSTITLVGDDLKRILSGNVTISPTAFAVIGTELIAFYSGTESIVWQWYKNGSAISGVTEHTYTPTETGSYLVTASAETYDSKTSAAVAIVNPVSDVPTDTLTAQLEWLSNNAEDYGNYVIEVSGDEEISFFNLSFASNIAITLKSTDSLRTITGSTMFRIESSITLVLDNNITLERLSDGTLVDVRGGAFIMNSGSALYKGRAAVSANGSFTMNGGTISGNNILKDGNIPSSSGGGVYVTDGTFTMNGGTIADNKVSTSSSASYHNSSSGGGVYVSNGMFTMNGGTIADNIVTASPYYSSTSSVYSISASSSGGGVYVIDGIFTMNDGTISGNAVYASASSSSSAIYAHTDARSSGGGVYVSGTFNMLGGNISDNTASASSYTSYSPAYSFGGGVYVNGIINMNGGTISDNTSHSSSSCSDFSPYTYGGGIYINGNLIMNNGYITSNAATAKAYSNSSGGGVYVGETFVMNNGVISDNTVTSSNRAFGGGVTMSSLSVKFTMNDGSITGNTASSSTAYSSYYSCGGGVCVHGGTFTMNGGTVSGNTVASSAPAYGGGVYVYSYGKFTKIGGIICGWTLGDSDSNVVKNSSGIVQSDRGFAVYVNDDIRREITAGSDVNLSWDGTVSPPFFSGDWEE